MRFFFQTPPASYRQRVDFHYNSLPRQSFATPISAASASLSANVSPAVSTNIIDQNANPTIKQRNVAFGKIYDLSNSSTKSSTINIDSNTSNLKSNKILKLAKPLSSSATALPSIMKNNNSASDQNVYHHQLFLYQPPQPIYFSPQQMKTMQKLRGYSVPNLGSFFKLNFLVMLCRCTY